MIDFPIADIEIVESMRYAPELHEAINLKGKKQAIKEELVGGVKLNAIRQEGLRFGAQSGLSVRYDLIMEYLDEHEDKLNALFNFAGFVRQGNLLIPSLTEVNSQLINEGDQLRTISKSYTIDSEAELVSTVPTWRDYLVQHYEKPQTPHSSILPVTPVEIKVWKSAVEAGWRSGVQDADNIFTDRVAQLAKDINGRYLYITTEKKNLLTPATVYATNAQVTFNGRTMNIDEKVFRVENSANFKSADNWEPIWTK